ncbi:23S rRNA (adenine(2030)-N(6))-methyltransferase RlmJ [Marinobacter zhanjiangensis]|uniref:Ribosomal RNA large subunit methyltransferase J n=1 Tax=Marinobacter zhanjiangensis TaxID=578215 RepID=A0ABQ3B257_9GAMM|nr:23S rRNA (adenine(2030)-N(6))-methyltransferase RlmJ [Marinobacter zhanjiangensis]GGY75353.1 ribosomal RNA large subunit methyltransferase J [Marinobacter zhanjiangensis]
MLSYLHEYHAGNFADVHKHAAQVLALTMMQAKPSAIAGFDTHAGIARYDLDADRARKTAEADTGIRRVWRQRDRLSGADWQPVLGELSRLNEGSDHLRYYPGSPAWFHSLQRAQDSLTAFELHSGESSRLQQWARERRVSVLAEDGLSGLLRQLPPRAPRLLVLMDPSYELREDYRRVADTLASAWHKCRHGVFLIWYPQLTSDLHGRLTERLASSGLRKIWHSEVRLRQPPERGMTGSGVLVVNPPWGFGDRLDAIMQEVSAPEGLGIRHCQGWLVPE